MGSRPHVLLPETDFLLPLSTATAAAAAAAAGSDSGSHIMCNQKLQLSGWMCTYVSHHTQELEENTEYEEKEDEFDINPKTADKVKPQPAGGDPHTEGVIDERVPVRPFQHLLLDSDDPDADGSEEPLLWLVGVSVTPEGALCVLCREQHAPLPCFSGMSLKANDSPHHTTQVILSR
jgi:hypothetical protein